MEYEQKLHRSEAEIEIKTLYHCIMDMTSVCKSYLVYSSGNSALNLHTLIFFFAVHTCSSYPKIANEQKVSRSSTYVSLSLFNSKQRFAIFKKQHNYYTRGER